MQKLGCYVGVAKSCAASALSCADDPVVNAQTAAGNASTLALLFGAAAMIHAPFDQVIIWTASLTAELWLVVALSILTVLTFAQVPAAVASALAFYVFARSVAALQLMRAWTLELF